MYEMPGQSCHCSENNEKQAGFCNHCGTRKQWISQGPHSDVYQCPKCD